MDAAALFTRHGHALERLAARITGDREEARDVVADAFAALLSTGPSDPHHAVPWLYVTVRHRAYNRVRRQALARRRLPALATEVTVEGDPESAVRDDPYVRSLISSATACLSDRDRIAVSMRHMEQAPYEEIASALGTTVMQARVVVHRANSKLRRNVIASLSRRGDLTCDGPLAVSDKLATLLTSVAVQPSWSTRVGDSVRRWWSGAHATTGRVAVHLGEVITPGAALVAVVCASTTAVAPVPDGPSPVAIAEPTTAQVRRDAVPGTETGVVPLRLSTLPPLPAGAGAAAAAAAVPGADGTIGSPVRFEDPGRAGTHARERSLLDVLGLPLVLTDPLDVSSLPEADIRSLELATLADRNGRPRALRWRIELSAPPEPSASALELHWGYEGTDCYTWFQWPTDSTPIVLTLCPVAPSPVKEFDLIPLRAALGNSPVELRFDGTVLEATLSFRTLDDKTRAFLRPGARLIDIVVHTQCPSGDCPTYDSAPDEGGYIYEVER